MLARRFSPIDFHSMLMGLSGRHALHYSSSNYLRRHGWRLVGGKLSGKTELESISTALDWLRSPSSSKLSTSTGCGGRRSFTFPGSTYPPMPHPIPCEHPRGDLADLEERMEWPAMAATAIAPPDSNFLRPVFPSS